MSTSISARQISLTGLFTAISFLLPIMFHSLGIKGDVILPMHIGVMLCGFFAGPLCGLLCGIISPVLSSVLTGMPALMPMLPLMLAELAVYGLAAGLVYSKTKKIYLSLIISMILGRLARAVVTLVMKKTFGINIPDAVLITGAIVAGIPGIALQLVLIPSVVRLALRNRSF